MRWISLISSGHSIQMQKNTPSSAHGIWRRQWHPTPVLLPGKSHGWRSLVGYSPWGHEELDTTERLPFHFSLSCTGEGNGNPLQCFCLENPRDGVPGGLPSMGSHRVGHDWRDLVVAERGIFSRIDHILGHKSNLSKFKKTEVLNCIFPNHNAIRLDINYKKKNWKKHKHMEIKQHISKKPTGYWRNQKRNKKNI